MQLFTKPLKTRVFGGADAFVQNVAILTKLFVGNFYGFLITLKKFFLTSNSRYFSVIASADEEFVLGNKIPLWLFGFLY